MIEAPLSLFRRQPIVQRPFVEFFEGDFLAALDAVIERASQWFSGDHKTVAGGMSCHRPDPSIVLLDFEEWTPEERILSRRIVVDLKQQVSDPEEFYAMARKAYERAKVEEIKLYEPGSGPGFTAF